MSDTSILTGQAFCTLCKAPCGTCGCRMGGCYTRAYWEEQWRREE